MLGYQGAGSLGRRMLEGEKVIRELGDEIAVEAEIRHIDGFSAHADSPQLFAFVEHARESLRRVFVFQGDAAPALHFTQEVRDRLGIPADAPELNQSVDIL